MLPGLLSGARAAAWCGARPVGGRPDGGGFTPGTCSVEAGAQADHLLVAVEHEGAHSQVLVPAGAAGLTVTPLSGLDLVRRFAEVRFDDVAVPADAVVGPAGDAAAEVEHAPGGLHAAVRRPPGSWTRSSRRPWSTWATGTRSGGRWRRTRPSSTVADDKVVLRRATASPPPPPGRWPPAARRRRGRQRAKAWIGPRATEMIQDCVQLHGGIGVTWARPAPLPPPGHREPGHPRTPEEHAERVAASRLGATA